VKHHPLTTGGDETIACPSCLATISRDETFCHECGAPVGTTAALDPINTIRAQGFLITRALEGRPKLIVLLGLWMLNLPAFVGGVFCAIYLPLHMDAFSGFIFFWFMIGLSILSFAILYRITKNYVTIPKKKWGEGE
jgi:hypothetical protein